MYAPKTLDYYQCKSVKTALNYVLMCHWRPICEEPAHDAC